MTNWLKIFLAFYILVGQPALLGWMLDNWSLYQLAWLNAWVFFIAWLISALCRPNESKSFDYDTAKVMEKRSEEKISRVENDSGISVVSVEKKQEVVFENDKIETQEQMVESLVEDKDGTVDEKLDENFSEKVEDKSEEKLERPMRENVSIPKIVQPLSWRQTPKKKEKEWMWWQRLVLLLTLAVAAVIAWTLWEFLWSRWIAIALFLWWILYLIIGKLFDVNGFYNAKKLFTNWLYVILIVAWICYGIYAMQWNDSFNIIKDKTESYVKDWFNSEKEDEANVDTWDIIYVFEWTGEVIVDTWDGENIMEDTWVLENELWSDIAATWIVENSELVDAQPENLVQPEINVQPEVEVQPVEVQVEEQIQAPVADDPNRQVTWWEAIKHLLQWYTLSKKTDKTFVYVAKSNELYPYFKTAQEKAMIWFDVNPNKNISCETYMSLKGILEWWKVNIYDRSQTRNIYWEKAYQLGKTNWCAKWSFVKVKNL